MITFFGASVTLQKTGYAKQLKSMLNEEVQIFGYGGMHISNAGICFIDEVLSVHPNYCFVDFFSTVYTIQNHSTIEYIDTIIYKFSKANCKLIFLFFPKNDENITWYNFCKKVLNEREITYLDLNENLKNINKNQYLKDIVHTNNYGSKLYAEIIFQEFSNIKDKLMLPKKLKPTTYTNIKKLVIEKEFNNKIVLQGSAQVIGFLNTIGPFSSIVDISIDEKRSYQENIWDQWCYYTRKHFNISLSLEKKVKITLSTNNFDTSTCKYNINFNNKTKKLILHEIYYVGKNLEVKNIEEGTRISKSLLKLLNYKGRFIQILSKFFKGLKK